MDLTSSLSDSHRGLSIYWQSVEKKVFWVHHSLRAAFREVGGEWFLKLEPGYVFTRRGHTFIRSSDAGALSTSRMSQERNYQVINHLYFWAWFLQHSGKEVRIPCGSQHLVVSSDLAAGIANFWLGTDSKTLTGILNSDYDLNWSELEETAGEEEDVLQEGLGHRRTPDAEARPRKAA